MGRIARALLTVCLVAAGVAAAVAARSSALSSARSWPMFHHDGATGREEWGIQVGPRLIASPSVGDLDGDGALEIVIASYDGKVYALGGS